MSDQAALLLSKCVFGGAIAVIIYIVYYEWKKSQIEAEQDEIEMGKLENENTINNQSDNDVLNAINEDGQGGSGNSSSKK